ncbi:MAG TPA: DUF1330 domain-containing protein [Candidatus Dormibacteraeota bacterium]|nr:DUF1330 domain-containing protein [Candidatus Dormibacteraeota bacterium]
MAAYYLVDVREVRDAAKMEDYRARIAPVVAHFGGRYVVIGGPAEVVEGSYRPVFPVMIEFPSMQEARRWYDSEDYRELKALRLAATVSNAFFMDGAAPDR